MHRWAPLIVVLCLAQVALGEAPDAGAESVPQHEWFIYGYLNKKGVQRYSLERDDAPGSPSGNLDLKGLNRALEAVAPQEWVRWIIDGKRSPGPSLPPQRVIADLEATAAARHFRLFKPGDMSRFLAGRVVSISLGASATAEVEFKNESGYPLLVSIPGLLHSCHYTALTKSPPVELEPFEQVTKSILLPAQSTFPSLETECPDAGNPLPPLTFYERIRKLP